MIDFLSIIIPIKNESQIIEKQIDFLISDLRDTDDSLNFEFIFVCNGCSDNSREICQGIVDSYEGRVIELKTGNYGQALFEGIRHAVSDYLFVINVEQWPREELGVALRNAKKFDCILFSKVIGTREQSKFRIFLTFSLNMIIKKVLHSPFSDTHGPKILKRSFAQSVSELCVLRFGQFDTELVLRGYQAGYSFAEVPFKYTEIRPPKNLMMVKILRNLRDVVKLIWFLSPKIVPDYRPVINLLDEPK